MADAVNPVLQGIRPTEYISDPYVRELYFGSADYPGLIDQARQAAQQTFLSDPILRQTAGLSPLELAAIQQAYGGIGAYMPYLQAQEQSILEAMKGIGAQKGLLQDAFGYQLQALQGFDPSDISRFYDPYEQAVVEQTTSDLLEAAAKQDVQQRAADIARGGESAFGSRARLGAAERQEALGRGLGEALSGIRSRGFGQALGAAQRESEFGRQALQNAVSGISGLAGDLGGIYGQIAGYGGQLGGLGATYQQLGQQERAELMGLGGVPRDLLETQLGRQYDYEMMQKYGPVKAAEFMRGFAPTYQPGQTVIQKEYGYPVDPLQYGLSAALGAYSSMYQQPGQQSQSSQQGGQQQTGYIPASYGSYGGSYGYPYGGYSGGYSGGSYGGSSGGQTA